MTPPGHALTGRLIVPHAWYGFRPKPNPLPKNITQWLSEIMPGLIDQTSWQAWFGGVCDRGA